MKKKRTPYYSGFTLIEMLIVLLIISVLVLLLSSICHVIGIM